MLVAHPALELFIAEPALDEADHELRKRIAAMSQQGRLTVESGATLLAAAQGLIDLYVTRIPAALYADYAGMARARIPRDPHDWPTVALALALNAGIWTRDNDFLGCGIATWTTETLLVWLGA